MTEIISNGSKWAGEPPDTIEDLAEVLKSEPLDRTFECYGNFVIAPDDGITKTVRFFGNFFKLSHVFSIDTDEPPVIEQLTTLIRANQQRPDYLAQDEPVEKNRKAALRDSVWLYAKRARLNSTADNGEKLVKINGHSVRLWDMDEESMHRFISEIEA